MWANSALTIRIRHEERREVLVLRCPRDVYEVLVPRLSPVAHDLMFELDTVTRADALSALAAALRDGHSSNAREAGTRLMPFVLPSSAGWRWDHEITYVCEDYHCPDVGGHAEHQR